MKRALFFMLAALASLPLQAQQWPTKPVTMINPFAPGGGVDAFGRPLSVYLSKTVGQQFIVENLAGAGGTIGAANAARRPGDGNNIIHKAQQITPSPRACTPSCRTRWKRISSRSPCWRTCRTWSWCIQSTPTR
jgi:tripartite-type tricarboxylate transporter receptor subunit TctC